MFVPVRITVALILFVAACGPKVDVNEPMPFDDDDDPQSLEKEELARIEAENPDREMELAAKTEGLSSTRRNAMVSRSDLNEVLDGGVGRFLGNVEVAPYLDVRQRFIGWEIVRLKLTGVDLRPGDIVLSVNQRKIERPNQVQKIWEDLRDTNAIYLSCRRAGKPFTVRIDVRDGDEQDEETVTLE
jgi:hypothetical protein